VLLKTFIQLVDAGESRFSPSTPDPLYAKDARHLTVLPEMVAFKDPLTVGKGYRSSLGSLFVMEIQTHDRRIGLERIC